MGDFNVTLKNPNIKSRTKSFRPLVELRSIIVAQEPVNWTHNDSFNFSQFQSLPMPAPSEIIKKLKDRYADCSSYSDRGELQRIVDNANFSETLPFRTHFVRPAQIYLKFREGDNTTIIRSAEQRIIFLGGEERDGKEVFVPIRQYESLEDALVNHFHHELFPTYAISLLMSAKLSSKEGIFALDYPCHSPGFKNEKGKEQIVLVCDSDTYGLIQLSINERDHSLKSVSITRETRTITCTYDLYRFNGKIPESVYSRIKAG